MLRHAEDKQKDKAMLKSWRVNNARTMAHDDTNTRFKSNKEIRINDRSLLSPSYQTIADRNKRTQRGCILLGGFMLKM